MNGAARMKSSPPSSSRRPGDSGIVERTRQRSILIVDPDRAARTPLALLLSDRYAVYEAEDGRMARRLASMIQNLAVVIAEVKLPTLDGLDLAKVWKSHDALKHIPFVFLSAGVSPNDVMRLTACGAREYLDKKLAPRTLARLVGKIARVTPLSYGEDLRATK